VVILLLPVMLSQVRVDHRNGTLHFGTQQMESDKIRNHLSLLAKRLAKAGAMMDPSTSAAVDPQRSAMLQLARENMAKEHSRLLARKQVGGREGGREGHLAAPGSARQPGTTAAWWHLFVGTFFCFIRHIHIMLAFFI
jgi:hypothetical protein